MTASKFELLALYALDALGMKISDLLCTFRLAVLSHEIQLTAYRRRRAAPVISKRDNNRQKSSLLYSYFFNTTVRKNLRRARPYLSREEMESATRAAQIHDFIDSLLKGYDTLIGEQGFKLSGGERQRLALARAFLKEAPILIFDEPTANLDPVTEKQVLDTPCTTLRRESLLLITHRLVGLETSMKSSLWLVAKSGSMALTMTCCHKVGYIAACGNSRIRSSFSSRRLSQVLYFDNFESFVLKALTRLHRII